MNHRPRPLADQVLVVTGGSSGIGLVTARMAAEAGAAVFLVARDAESLTRAAAEIGAAGGRAAWAVADVADRAAVEAAADACVAAYGRIDTWVNDAGVSAYGRIDTLPLDDARRIFETNYWGVVHGSLAALARLRSGGGSIVTVGSVLSDRSIPLQGHYAASKHAVKGFTDALRMEIEKDGLPVNVTLVKPSAINSAYLDHAGNRMDVAPSLPPPVYAPEVVARAILAVAERPRRDVTVGAGRMLAVLGQVAPRLTDRWMEAFIFAQQRREGVPRTNPPAGILHTPAPGGGHAHGPYTGHVMRSSLYTAAVLRPGRTLAGLAAVGLGVALGARARR